MNLPIFSESIEYNTYFNRKLHLENHASSSTPPIVISDIMDRPPAIWFSSKEKTNVCSDCEFRRMCIDKRIPTQQSEGNKWFHTSECNYNPYIAKWQGEEGYRTLAECGVISNEKEFSVDHKRIAEINQKLWEL